MAERNSVTVSVQALPERRDSNGSTSENSTAETAAVIDVRSDSAVVDLTGGNDSLYSGASSNRGSNDHDLEAVATVDDNQFGTITAELDLSAAPDDIEARAEALAPILARLPSGEHPEPGLLRRMLDLLVVAALVPVAIPLIVAAAILLKIEAPSAPVFYRQARTGYRGRRFRIVKLRSMVRDADELKAELAAQNLRSGPDFKVADDPRITSVGRQLRRTSIDELPQLWNVLRGDMTIVGPRPTSLDLDAYVPWQLERFEVMPGLTGLWQVAARDSESWDDRIALDIGYVRRVCPRLDLWILVRTVQVVIKGVGST